MAYPYRMLTENVYGDDSLGGLLSVIELVREWRACKTVARCMQSVSLHSGGGKASAM